MVAGERSERRRAEVVTGGAMKVYDISMTVRPGMQVWGNVPKKQPELVNLHNYSNAENYESRILMDAHTGTHLDAPLHMLEGGAKIETIPLTETVGNARVLDLIGVRGEIGRAELEGLALQAGEWILLKTQNSFTESFGWDFVFLREDGAHYLVERGVKGVGTDGLGIERSQPGFPTHKALLGNGIHIVEGLRLADVPAGNYFMVVAPLKLEGIEAAPARALLIGG
ncbi:MAG: cyclase [Paenibacillaceae bacterium]|nr:cyclase [Paenibacillaceae bacterium]